MEWIIFFQGKSHWIIMAGLFIVLLLQTVSLHKIKKTAVILKRIEDKIKHEDEKIKEQGAVSENVQQSETKRREESESTQEGQGVKESPEQLIDAVLAEVFR